MANATTRECSFSVPFHLIASGMADDLRLASPEELADALAFALRYNGRKRAYDATEYMAAIAAKRLVEHLDRSGFVIMKKPPAVGGAAIGRGFEKAAK